MVKCICIDDSDKSKFIHSSEWIKKDNEYSIIFVSFHPGQGGIQGCLLAEVSLTEKSKPYEYYKLSRFAILKSDWDKFIELCKNCTELDNVSIEELIKETELQIIEE
jgi:hypothetical protein